MNILEVGGRHGEQCKQADALLLRVASRLHGFVCSTRDTTDTENAYYNCTSNLRPCVTSFKGTMVRHKVETPIGLDLTEYRLIGFTVNSSKPRTHSKNILHLSPKPNNNIRQSIITSAYY